MLSYPLLVVFNIKLQALNDGLDKKLEMFRQFEQLIDFQQDRKICKHENQDFGSPVMNSGALTIYYLVWIAQHEGYNGKLSLF